MGLNVNPSTVLQSNNSRVLYVDGAQLLFGSIALNKEYQERACGDITRFAFLGLVL